MTRQPQRDKRNTPERVGEVVLVRPRGSMRLRVADQLLDALDKLGVEPGEAFSVVRTWSLKLATIAEQGEKARSCECQNPLADRDLFIWRGDPEWWSCGQCDGRVRPLTEAEKATTPSYGRRPLSIRHFLVTRRHGKLERVLAFDDADEALRALEKEERELEWLRAPMLDPDVECVLLGADRLATCIATHGNWFDEPSTLFEDLDRDLTNKDFGV